MVITTTTKTGRGWPYGISITMLPVNIVAWGKLNTGI